MNMDRYECGLIELKFAGSESAMTFSGYGAVFGNTDSYGDVIQPGAFADSLANAQKTGQWPAMLLQHGGWGMGAQDMTPIGVWTSLSEDGHGLRVEGSLAPTPRGQEVYALMKMHPRPAIDGLSIGYIAKEWTARSKPEEPRRLLKKVDLIEISPVTFPANPKARVQNVKSGELSEREFERWLMQDAGYSRSEARVIINSGFKALVGMQDAVDDGLADLTAAMRRGTAILQSTL
jgi:uncharacterized protein